MMKKEFLENVHYYTENGRIILTEKFHLDRGSCCGNGCRHCPYYIKNVKGNTQIDNLYNSNKFITFKEK